MILPALILLPLLGAALAWLLGRTSDTAPRWCAIATLGLDAVLLAAASGRVTPPAGGRWLLSWHRPWIPELGIGLRFDLDGLSLLLLWLTLLLSVMAVVISWKEITAHVGFFHVNLLATVSGIIGVFLATDLFLFFFFWELMLVPMYLLVVLWGHERRLYAGIKFFLFTQGSGLVMLVAILALALVHRNVTGTLTFAYDALLDTPMSDHTAMLLMLGFFLAFAVKLPVVPLHNWLPDTHTQAPTAGSVLLAGVLLKTGAYGLLRFVVPLFPHAAHQFTPVALALGVIGILYGALLAMGQNDMKRLVAYSSISHLGFVLLGVFAWNALALQGALMQMVAHGLSTGALFILVGALQDRLHTRDMREMGGFWTHMPKLSAMALFFAIASLGLPGLGNFLGEFLTLAGTWQSSPPAAVLGAGGLVMSALYALLMMQRVFFGVPPDRPPARDLGPRQLGVMGVLVACVIALGIYPQPVFRLSEPSLFRLLPTPVLQTASLEPRAGGRP